jgi:hypothetical protein
MNAPSRIQAPEMTAENRLPAASTAFTAVVSPAWPAGASAVGRPKVKRSSAFAPPGDPGRWVLAALFGSMSARRCVA